jgi:hypothetical protein
MKRKAASESRRGGRNGGAQRKRIAVKNKGSRMPKTRRGVAATAASRRRALGRRRAASASGVEDDVVVGEEIMHIPPQNDDSGSTSIDTLKSILGPTMAAARRALTLILKRHRLDEQFESDTLLRLMEFQPPARGSGRVNPAIIQGFMRAKRPPHNNVCLFAILAGSGAVMDVSWVRAVRNLYDRFDTGAERKRKVLSAFRNEAFKSLKMAEAHERFNVGVCGGCGLRKKLTVDHAGMPFAEILDTFLAYMGVDDAFQTVQIAWSGGAQTLKHDDLARRWRAWHDERAELVGLCKRCNSSKGSQGYRHHQQAPPVDLMRVEDDN